VSAGRVPKVVVLGGAVIDLYFRIPGLPTWKQAVQASKFKLWPGGKGLNQAIAASKLGAEVSMISATGNDDFGRRVIDALDINNVSHDFVKMLEGKDTDVAAVFVQDETGEPAFIGWKGMTIAELDRRQVKAAEDVIRKADVLLATFEVSLEAIEEAVSIAKSAGVKVIVNPAPPHESPISGSLLEKIDVLVPNIWEAQKLLRTKEENPRTLALWLMGTGVKVACITTSESGCVVAFDGEVKEFRSEYTIPRDTTGGSDAFCAALALGLFDADNGTITWDDAFTQANAAGHSAVTKEGGAMSMPTKDDLYGVLERWKKLPSKSVEKRARVIKKPSSKK